MEGGLGRDRGLSSLDCVDRSLDEISRHRVAGRAKDHGLQYPLSLASYLYLLPWHSLEVVPSWWVASLWRLIKVVLVLVGL